MKLLKTVKEYQEATAKGNVIVVFGSTQKCPTCDQLALQLKTFKASDKSCVVHKAHVQDFADEAKRFSIRSVPVMVFYKDGQPCDVQVGLKKAEDISASVANYFV